MPHPVNILNALPTASAPRPPNATESTSGPRPAVITDALPGPLPVNALDSLPGQDPDGPVRILDALPITRYQSGVAISDVSASFGWTGEKDGGATQVPFPNIFTTIDEAAPDDADYATNFINLTIGGSYIFQINGLVDPGVTAGFALHVRTVRTGTTGVVLLVLEITNFPGLTFFSRTLTDGDLRGNSGINNWVFPLTALEAAAITTYGSIRAALLTGGGPPGVDPGEVRVPWWDFRIPKP